MHVSGAARSRRLTASVPVTYLIFDVLHLDGRSTITAPYRKRRALLDELALSGPSWRTPPALFGGGPAVLAAAREQHLEGVVAKQIESAYQPGARSRTWLKIKEPAHPGGAHRWMAPRAWTAGRQHRVTTARHPDPGRAALRRQGRHRVHHRLPCRPTTPTRTVGHEPLRAGRRRATSGCTGRALGHTRARRRGPVHRVDTRRATPAPRMARPATRQERRPGRPRNLTRTTLTGALPPSVPVPAIHPRPRRTSGSRQFRTFAWPATDAEATFALLVGQRSGAESRLARGRRR